MNKIYERIAELISEQLPEPGTASSARQDMERQKRLKKLIAKQTAAREAAKAAKAAKPAEKKPWRSDRGWKASPHNPISL